MDNSARFLSRSDEALAEAAYHVVFIPCTDLKGRQQLRGRYEGHEKGKRHYPHLSGVFSHLSSSAALASSGSAERKTLSLNLPGKFSVSKDAEPSSQFVNQSLATMHATLCAALRGTW